MTLQAWCALLHASVLVAASPFAYIPEVEEPRSAGHFIGDMLTQRIPLDQGERHFQPSSLPPADRVGLWFQRLPSRLEVDADGRRWLVLNYQVINSPLLPVSVALPALTISTASNAPVRVESWPIHISPLAAKPAYANIEPLPLRPDRTPAPLATRSLRRQLAGWSTGLVVTLTAWLTWVLWRERREALHLPFARALRQLRSLDSPAEDAGAWIHLHRALNETAGWAIQESSLARLFASSPHLLPLRPELEDFYRRSNARFFSTSAAAAPFAIVDLCRRLRRIEKRASRGHVVRF